MRTHLWIQFLLPVSFVLLCSIAEASQICILPQGFARPTRANFKSCRDNIARLTPEERNSSGCFERGPGETVFKVLTLDGCVAMCGPRTDPWDWKDVYNRLSLLILPTVVMFGHLGFPSLGLHIYLIVPVQAIGNPIGRFRSLLIRFSTHRSFRRIAETQFGNISPGHPEFVKSLATVFSAYEEFGWQNLAIRGDWPKTLSEKEQHIIMDASSQLSFLRPTSKVPAIIAIATLVWALVLAIFRTINQIEVDNVRINNETAHTVAIVCILFITIPQVWFGARIGFFTSDIGAIKKLEGMKRKLDGLTGPDRCMSSPFPPLQFAICPKPQRATFFSRCPLQNPTLPEDAEPFEDHELLEYPEPLKQPQVLVQEACDQRRQQLPLHMRPWEQAWRGICGNFMGISSSWRGCNHIARDSQAPSNWQLIVVSFLFATAGAGIWAVFLSATNNAVKTKVGIGCRSLSWVAVMFLWMLSYGLDSIIRGDICRRYASKAPVDKLRKIWWTSVVKDLISTMLITAIVMAVQFGAYNSCRCRSSFRNIVNLFGYTSAEWIKAQHFWTSFPLGGLAFTILSIVLVELDLWNREGLCNWVSSPFAIQGGTPLCKSEKEMEDELKALEQYE